MGWWTDTRDAAEAIFAPEFESDSARKKTTGITGAINKGYSEVGGAFNRVIGRQSTADKRLQLQAITQQTQAYKDQTNLTNQQITDARNAEDVTKRQIQEKQIRALRNNYRPAGGYSSGPGGVPGTGASTGLGNDASQPSKLGTA